MKFRKENIKFWKDEFVRTLKILFIISPLFLVIWTGTMGVASVFEGLKPIMTSEECSYVLKVSFPFLIIYAIVWWKVISKMIEKDAKKEAQEKEVRLQGLKSKYSKFIAIVDEAIKKQLSNIRGEFSINEDYEYLLIFEDYLNKVDSRNSFVLASCLMYGLLKVEPRIKCESRESGSDLYITADIAMSSAFKIISEPVTCYYEGEKYMEEKHPKVDVVLPKGLGKNLDLYNGIKNTILVQAEEKVTALSIMQMANLLHLIYLNSSNK